MYPLIHFLLFDAYRRLRRTADFEKYENNAILYTKIFYFEETSDIYYDHFLYRVQLKKNQSVKLSQPCLKLASPNSKKKIERISHFSSFFLREYVNL